MSLETTPELKASEEQDTVWPPGFKSRLTDPNDPLTIIPKRNAENFVKAGKAGRAKALSTGSGWGNGTIESMALPQFNNRMVAPSMRKVFRMKHDGISHRMYCVLKDEGTDMSASDIAKRVNIKPHDVSPNFQAATRAGAILVIPVGGGKFNYRICPEFDISVMGAPK